MKKKKDRKTKMQINFGVYAEDETTKYADGSIRWNEIKIMRFWAPHHFPDVTVLIT